MQKLPLDGIRVMDFGQMWAGPHLTSWLVVMGAEVIKVETSLRMDYMRTVGMPPAFANKAPNAGSAFAGLNFGKKGIVLNMNTPKALELARKLVQKCDVVTENFGGSILDRWGLSYDDMKKLKPDIIYYAGSGYGRSGPHKERPAYAEIVEAFDGSTFANGYPGGEPATVGVSPWMDAGQAMHGAFNVLTAVYHRKKTGEGQYIDGAMIEGSTNFLGEPLLGYVMNGVLPERVGNRDGVMAPHGCYRCQGEGHEWVAIAIADQREWLAFCGIMGNPEWTKQPEFSDELSRWKNQDALDKHVQAWTRRHHPVEITEMLQKAGIAATPSINTQQAISEPHLAARRFFADIDHPILGKIHLPGLPWRLSDSPRAQYPPPPALGEHNKYVFGDILGLSQEEIKSLEAEKVLY